MILQRRLPALLPTQPYDQPQAGPSRLPLIAPIARRSKPRTPVATPTTPPKRPPSRTEKKFECTFDGCDKAYFKPSRLVEHELTHTGERPHKCPECAQTYLRASHLHAHMRTHLPEEARAFECTRDGCDKKFWTVTHLKRHEAVHDNVDTHPCEKCDATFAKTHQLRDHVILAHMPPGTKPYPCPQEGCEWSFALKAHLKAHEKTHDPTRYMCSHPAHPQDQPFPNFPTWSALQSHLHLDHPPSCPHVECNGRVFKSTGRLKEHLKVHADRQADLELSKDSEPSTPERDGDVSKKRRRRSDSVGGRPKLARLESGEAGKIYGCEVGGCEKRFKTKYALASHNKATHLNQRPHKCPHHGCFTTYPHASNLARHLIAHAKSETAGQSVGEASSQEADIDFTGETMSARRYGCPVGDGCIARFWRVYDIRRHLKGEHGLDLDDTEVRKLVV